MSLDSPDPGATPPPMDTAARQIIVADSPDDLTARAAELFVKVAQQAVAEHDQFTVALSGGETPRHLYAALASSPYAEAIPWDRVQVFWGDERHVPPDDDESNYRMAHETLLSKVPIPAGNVHRVRAELPDASEAAREYEDELRDLFRLRPNEWPNFDLILLGMGPDGHTASLFPGSAALSDTTHLVAAPWVDKFSAFRITLTPPVLNTATTVAFLVSGAAKAAMVRNVLEGPYQPELLPAQVVAPRHGRVLWMVDQAAAALGQAST